MKNFIIFFYIFLIFSIFLYSIFYFYLTSNLNFENNVINKNYYFSNSDFYWPLPGYHTITSFFGKRKSPTSGASTNHSGIDISAPEGSNIYSICDGYVNYIGFSGANGYIIQIESNNFIIIYAHVSPNYIVQLGTSIYANQLIGNVGPKYISEIPNSPYKDSTGRFTNGATTGPHLHLTIKKDGIAVNPLDFF